MIRLLFNDVQALKDGRHPQGEQMYRRSALLPASLPCPSALALSGLCLQGPRAPSSACWQLPVMQANACLGRPWQERGTAGSVQSRHPPHTHTPTGLVLDLLRQSALG